jgi:hypothetical protein
MQYVTSITTRKLQVPEISRTECLDRNWNAMYTHEFIAPSPQGADRGPPMHALDCFVISSSETLIKETDEEAAKGF